MLDNGTKTRIDNLRDTLVGVLPSPESQVEQITTGLIYKFMSDIDAQSVADGGVRSFFVGEYEKYAFENLTDTKLGGEGRVQLYSAAIDSMQTNPKVPLLFREIFKNSFLKFRDPAILTLFIQGISEFNHSDTDLGDEFEYLLKFMAAQGAAGQFITPRNIVDFIVSVVNPQKKDEILDPACGTAGFLISAYQHIQKQNKKKLDDEDLMALGENLIGYDISPDMTRISRVNLYLHGFHSPLVYDYDTLTDDEKWNEYYDVILANPPFMTPRGGIKPHDRFSVQARRAEVLFVDYIAEHLRPDGRAGIIVPEGIIFQSANTYKELRKRLINDCGLYAVVSLPSGVFNPYTGVKTSILFLDKGFETDDVLFVKVENDGRDLGAQQRPIDKNDLPKALDAIQQWQKLKTISANSQAFAHSVSKTEIADGGDYSLAGERYREPVDYSNLIWEAVPLKDFCKFEKGKSSSTKTESGMYPLVLTAKYRKTASHFDFDADAVLVPLISSTGHGKADLKTVHIQKGKFAAANLLAVILPDTKRCSADFLYLMVDYQKDNIAKQKMSGAANVSMKLNDLHDIKIPLPPLEVQEQIVAELDGYQKVIDGAKQVVDNWKPQIKIDPDWQAIELGEILHNTKNTIDPNTKRGNVRYIGLENIEKDTGDIVGDISESYEDIKSAKSAFSSGQILYGRLRPNLNKVAYTTHDGICSTDILVLDGDTKKVSNKFYAFYMRSKAFNDKIVSLISGSQLPRVRWESMAKVKVPAPPLEEQQRIVAELESEQATVTQCKELIKQMERKIATKISEVWGEE